MRVLAILAALAGLAACSGEADERRGAGAEAGAVAGAMADAAGSVTEIVTSDAPTSNEPIIATRAEAEETYKCEGLITAIANRNLLAKRYGGDAELPEELANIRLSDTAFWGNRVERMTVSGMSKAELRKLRESYVDPFLSGEELTRRLPEVRACREIQQAG
ncbi:hypothetical protein [Erythrobacter cryptus]|uniref:hypothetical protein n=1 Tax=Erythrobacter cryptus TaxID=196588 RepID=UPI0012EC0DA0|nr:hypothetical protein [Erythrobacter cryptus]GIX19983.1 MAG: hypothetical protein KatS3mg120_1659 [Erythrobacter sp.]